MNTNSESIIEKNSVFAWVLFGTLLVLLIPALAMIFTNEVQWKIADFIVMGTLLFGFGCLFVLVSRKTSATNRIFVAIFFVLTFLVVWAELAVGIFTDIGS